ncbi:hypothetical protein RB601_001391 [Gaeumannomyces tritici]
MAFEGSTNSAGNPYLQGLADRLKKQSIASNDAVDPFGFRPWGPGKPERQGRQDLPLFNLKSVSHALSRGWNPNISWTEDELVFPIPGVGPLSSAYDPWYTFNTPLHRALWLQQFDVAECLVRHGADINRLNARGYTVLHEALDLGIDRRNDWSRDVSWIVKHGADLGRKTEARFVRTGKNEHRVLGQDKKSRAVHALLSGMHQEPEPEPEFGKHRDARAERREPSGLSPLMLAMELADVQKVQTLLDAGADIELPVDAGAKWKILDLALMSRQLSLIQILEQAGASFSVDITESTPMDTEDEVRLHQGARNLVSFCLSGSNRGLVPAPECEEVFRYVLQGSEFRKVWDIRGGVEGLLKYGGIVDAFVGTLSRIAQTRNLQAVPATYCTLCRNTIAKCSVLPSTGTVGSARGPFEHTPSLRELEHSVSISNCPFCRLLLDAVNRPQKQSKKGVQSEGGEEQGGLPVRVSLVQEYFVGQFALRVECGSLSSDLEVSPLEEEFMHNVADHQSGTDESGTASRQATGLGKAWLATCKKNHPKCRRSQDVANPILPTRVLDLTHGTEEDPAVCLVETHGARDVYCALSYCWGTTKATTTVKDNLEQHLENISMESLPSTIQDSITAARNLGFRYLWIDALCIVQDDADDWEAEAAKMSSVYSNATLTISTLFGSDCGDKLFVRRDTIQPQPLPFPIPAPYFLSKPRPLLAVQPRTTTAADGRSASSFRGPIHSRGWTLQEQMLSTRILWFGSEHLQWECVSLRATEPEPNSWFMRDGALETQFIEDGNIEERNLELRMKEIVHRPLRTDGAAARRRPEDDAREMYLEWENVVAEYTKRDLTKESDRIAAVLGLADMMGPIFRCDFVAGVWKGDYFLRSLAWRVVKAPASTTATTASSCYPSWTWAAMPKRAVDYALVRDHTERRLEPLARLVSMADVSVSGKAQGRATGSVVIRGPLQKVNAVDQQSLLRLAAQDMRAPDYDYHLDAGGAMPAADASLRPTWHLDLFRFEHGSPWRGYGFDWWRRNGRPGSTIRLILEAVDHQEQDPQVFRRVGIARFYWKTKPDVAVRDVRIV